jgi:RNA polymerase-binding transcription factor DksA
MHYHYFTIEQREALSREIRRIMSSNTDGTGGLSSALARLRAPDYGVCEVCNEDVPFIRLMNDPLARRCRHCESNP